MLRSMAETASPEIHARITESFELWNDGEPQLMLDEYAEDAELDLSAFFTDMPVFRGHAGIRGQIDEFWKTWQGVRMKSLEVFDVGRGRFVVEARLWGKGKRSGAEVDQRVAWLYTLREPDQKIIRSQLFPTVQAAMNYVTDSAAAPSG
jgi:ketosteroid isomerase-like protein